MRAKCAAAVLLVAIGIVAEVWIGDIRGIWFNFALAALIAASFFLNILEILFVSFFAILILNWQPVFGLEVIAFIALPLGSKIARDVLSLEPWVLNILMTAASVTVLYIFFGSHTLFNNWILFSGDLFLSVAYSLIAFKAMDFFYPSTSLH